MPRKKKHTFHNGESGAALAIHLKRSRGASRFVKVLKDGTVVVKIGQGQGPINTRLLEFISEELAIPPAKLQLIAGEESSKKLISILDSEPKQLQKKILAKIA